jgi:hypothetical protein
MTLITKLLGILESLYPLYIRKSDFALAEIWQVSTSLRRQVRSFRTYLRCSTRRRPIKTVETLRSPFPKMTTLEIMDKRWYQSGPSGGHHPVRQTLMENGIHLFSLLLRPPLHPASAPPILTSLLSFDSIQRTGNLYNAFSSRLRQHFNTASMKSFLLALLFLF